MHPLHQTLTTYRAAQRQTRIDQALLLSAAMIAMLATALLALMIVMPPLTH